jgi:hypothetical protein
MQTCTYDQSLCYDVRTVPVITRISETSGYTTGGQNLTIEGHGFDNETISIMIDGQECVTTMIEKSKIECETSTRTSKSRGGPNIGQQGVSRKFIGR